MIMTGACMVVSGNRNGKRVGTSEKGDDAKRGSMCLLKSTSVGSEISTQIG